jgi:hypothetical protein
MKKILLPAFLLLLITASKAQTSGTLTVSVTTAPTGMGYYEPLNIEAIWIEDSSNKFVKTMLVNGYVRTADLDIWETSSNGNTVDAKTGATQQTHGTRTCTWKSTNESGTVVADGTYKIKMQLTDDEFSGLNTSFIFTKSPTALTLTPANVLPSFKNISIQWVPANTAIGDVKQDNLYSIYPNPTKSTAYVNGIEIREIELCTLEGKSIFKTNDQRLNLSTLPKGVYLARITTKTATFTKKIEKE